VLRDGWFATGDVGALDPSGALTLIGRTKTTIMVAGLKFFAEEVEAVLATAPGVVECRVFARPHPRLGELPHAAVVLAPGTTFDRDAVAAHCARELSPYKVPVDITAVATIAKTAGGKILRR
jgi:acyl-CoA synthetase (AMP-forming)/AMP-acid ligase II